MAKLENYGIKPNDESINSAYAINKCIQEHSICEFEEGTYYIGGDIDINDPEKLLRSEEHTV